MVSNLLTFIFSHFLRYYRYQYVNVVTFAMPSLFHFGMTLTFPPKNCSEDCLLRLKEQEHKKSKVKYSITGWH